jgi:hypothetical protein
LAVPGPESEWEDPIAWLLETTVSPQLLDWNSAEVAAQSVRQ